MISDRIDVHCNNPTPPKLYASLKTNPSKKTFSLQPQELRRMSMDELTKYVLSLQRELTSIQNRSSTLDPEKYQKLLVECDIKDEKHWIKQKIPTDSEWNNSSSRSSSDNLKEHSDNFKTPGFILLIIS
ncbi:hypothetical protein HZS_7937 [Henneguya salminicola]|nr:hypothetical protein HZS_7937 [Henneguya salminicola]